MKEADAEGKVPGRVTGVEYSMLSMADQTVSCPTGLTIWIQPLQPSVSSSKTVLPPPEPSMLATPLFLGDSSSLSKIEALWVDKSETDSTLCKRAKTDSMDKECKAQIADAKHTFMLCK